MSRETPEQMPRNRRIVKWTREKPDDGAHATWTDEVWWGYWHNGDAGDRALEPPDALFPSESQAKAFAGLIGKEFDTFIGPCVLRIEFRDNFEVPE